MHQPPKAIDCQQCGLLVPELDWPRHVAQHRRGEIPARSVSDAMQVNARQRQRAPIPADRIDLWRRIAIGIEMSGETGTLSLLATALLLLLEERPELEALRADAEGRRHAEYLLRTAGEPRPRPVIATELGELSDRLTILETQTRQLRGSVFADNASVSPASTHTLPALRDRYLELARRVISLERFAATTEARRTAAELGAKIEAIETPPPAAIHPHAELEEQYRLRHVERHQPEPAGERDAHATCIGLDNGCPECIRARDAGPRDTND